MGMPAGSGLEFEVARDLPSVAGWVHNMSIQRVIKGDECEFVLPARVDGATANQLEIEVLEVMRGGAKTILINLAASNFLCSAGIRVILQYHRQMKTQGKVLLVSRTSPEIDQILELTGFRDQIVEKR